jgi:hypothetical protein
LRRKLFASELESDNSGRPLQVDGELLGAADRVVMSTTVEPGIVNVAPARFSGNSTVSEACPRRPIDCAPALPVCGKVVDDSEVAADHQVEHWIRRNECSDLEVTAAVEPTTQGQTPHHDQNRCRLAVGRSTRRVQPARRDPTTPSRLTAFVPDHPPPPGPRRTGTRPAPDHALTHPRLDYHK